MKTKEIKIYSFDELNEKAKAKAIDKFSDINIMDEWYEFVYDDAKQIGLNINTFDLYKKDITGKLTVDFNEVCDNIISQHGEKCETYKIAQKYKKIYNELVCKYSDGVQKNRVAEGNEDSFDDDANDLENQFKNELLEEYLQILNKEYEYLISEQAIIETIQANEYEFTEDGNKFNY